MELNYQIALTNVPFDNSYKNVLRFDTRSEQEAYFQTNTLFSNSPDVNFNVGSLYATNVVYDGNENENINELLNKNYCVVKDKRENATIKYFYYYITNAKQDCDNRILLALELDIFQTYYIDLQFSDSVIYKAHLNRFVDNGNGTVSFDGRPTSQLFEREDIQNVSKRLNKRTVLKLYDNSIIGNWLKENIACWVYIYYDPLLTYKYTNIYGNETSVGESKAAPIFINSENGNVPSNISVFVYPIYKSNKIIKFNMTNPTEQPIAYSNIAWGDWLAVGNRQYFNVPAVQTFANKNNGYVNIYSTKVSILPPFDTIPNNINYTIDNGNLILNSNVASFNGKFKNPLLSNLVGTSVAQETFVVGAEIGPNAQMYASSISQITIQENIVKTSYSVEKQINFLPSEIINVNKNSKFNPKLLNNDYFELIISDSTENGFVYDFQKLNDNNLEIGFTEAMTPDITKRYIRILSKGGIYIQETSKNLTGFINSNDNSLIMPTTAYQNMLANNKNYFLQNAINNKMDLTMGLLNAGKNIIGGIASYNAGAVGSGITDLISTGMNFHKKIVNENFTIDNLKNAPSNIVGAKGNIWFENMYSENGIVVEEYEILDNEKEIINDYMCMYGFTYNKIDNIKNVDNIRKFYNYVRADIETINSSNVSISETVRKKFRECFANGVRFWNTDTFAYNKENYERWLENE